MEKKLPIVELSNRKVRWGIVILILLSIVPVIDLLRPGLFVAHDSLLHAARAASFYQSLTEGNVIPRWGGNLNLGYGHPALEFYYPAPSYIIAILHVIGFSFVDGLKILFGVSFIASILAMYVWVNEAWGYKAGFLSALIYGFSPYRFVDLYVRGAIGEHIEFVLMPLALFFALKLAKESNLKWSILLSLTIAFVILSHNVVSIFFIPILFLYALYLYIFISTKKKYYLYLFFIGLTIGFCLSAFYWIPAYFEGRYTLRDIVTNKDFSDKFVPWDKFLLSSWNFGGGDMFSKSIGIVGIAFLTIGLVITFFWKITFEKRVLFYGSYAVFILSLFLMTKNSHLLWESIPLMQKFQFPWRFLTVTVLTISIIVALVVNTIGNKLKIGLLCFIAVMTLLLTSNMWTANEYTMYSDEYLLNNYEGTTDASGENSPIWSIRFMEVKPKQPIEVIDGNADIMNVSRTFESHTFTVTVNSDKARILDNTLYFPGWTVFIDNSALSLIDVWFQDPDYRGLINFWMTQGTHAVRIEFLETKLRLLANSVSIASLIVLFFLTSKLYYKRKL